VAAPGAQEPTPEWVQSKIDDLAANTALDAAAREQAGGFYKTALTRLEAARASEAVAGEFRRSIESAPRALAEVRVRLKELAAARERAAGENGAGPPPPPAWLDSSTVPELEQRLTGVQVQVSELRKNLGEMEDSLRAMLGRPAEARKEMLAEKQTMEELDRSIGAPAPAGEAGVVSAARLAALKTRRLASVKQVDALDQELLSLPSRQDLLTARRDLATADLAELERQSKELQAALTVRKQQAARDQQVQAENTRREVAGAHPALAAYAEENTALTRSVAEVNTAVAAVTQAQASIKSRIDQLAENEQSSKQLLEIGAIGEEYGVFLRELRARLPDTSRVQSEISARERAIIESRLQRLRAQEKLRVLSDVDGAVDQLIAAAPASGIGELRPKLRELVVSRKETLTRLVEGYNERVRLLTAANADARELSLKRGALASLLDERLLWLPSTSALNAAWWTDVVAGGRWLFEPGEWAVAGRALWPGRGAQTVGSGLVLATLVLLFAGRRRLRGRLDSIAVLLGRVSTDRFSLTVQTLVISFLLALPWPLLLGHEGGVLTSGGSGHPFVGAVGSGLMRAAAVLLILGVFHTMCRPNGLFIAHFGWGERSCKRLRRELRWLMVAEAVAAFIIAACDAGGNDSYRTGLGRLAFLAGSLALAVFMFRIFNPRRGAVAEFVARVPLLWRLRVVWFPLVVAVPGALGVLAALGYYESAAAVQSRVFATGWVLLVTLICYRLAVRWLLVAQRRLAYEQAIERRERAREARAKESTTTASEAAAIPPEEPRIDISEVSQQTQTLLRFAVVMVVATALWAIWSKLFPAIRVLDHVTLWTHAVDTRDGEKIVPVTLWTLTLALLTMVVTWVGARNLPGLVEIAVLQRMDINSGTRYTVATLTRYTIVIVGLVLAFGRLGADWSKMQWIVAALGVGLGFGLQEIVANFVSGLIILFEQPVRVGDLVTVGDRIGMVSRIQSRATTIIDPDNREVIIPNKAFITERVTNWALNDPVTRLLINVGIAYGSDTTLAHRVLLDTVRDNPLVLGTPAPAVLFMGFGDSALNFEVRVYVREIADRIPLTHELHMAIDRALRQHKIEIPFPQRTVHLRGPEASIGPAAPGTHAPGAADPAGSRRPAAGRPGS